MLKVGLTGSVATGKSTVAQMLAQKGARVLDADRIVHQLIQPSGKCYRPIIKAFGKEILAGQFIDTKKLANIVFNNKRLLKKLEHIIHPKVRAHMNQKMREYARQKKNQVVVLDIPLLFESQWHKNVDITVVVIATRAQQIERAQKKLKTTKADIMRRIKAQLPLRDKVRLADITIDNRRSLTQTKKQVEELWQKLLLKKRNTQRGKRTWKSPQEAKQK